MIELYNDKFENILHKIKFDVIITDPPYPNFLADEYVYYDGIIDWMKKYKCKQIVFWTEKEPFVLDYGTKHIWHKQCGTYATTESIFEINSVSESKTYSYQKIKNQIDAQMNRDIKTIHPSQKPIRLTNELINDFTKKGARPLKDNPAANVEKGDIANNLKNLTTNSLDPIKQEYPSMKILSGYRQPKNNTDVSQNTTGEAVDIKIEGLDRRGHWEAIQWIQQNVPYDQLILEYDSKTYVWIHISLKKTGNRKEHYTMFHNKRKGNMGEFIYIPEAE